MFGFRYRDDLQTGHISTEIDNLLAVIPSFVLTFEHTIVRGSRRSIFSSICYSVLWILFRSFVEWFADHDVELRGGRGYSDDMHPYLLTYLLTYLATIILSVACLLAFGGLLLRNAESLN